MAIETRFIDSLEEVDAEEWNALNASAYPFTRYEFLAALEQSKAVGHESGWCVKHLLLSQDDTLIAAVPCYEKTHSYGEYVFDQSWANAYYQNGYEYYPKLTLAIPFTPITGPRLLWHASADPHEVYATVMNTLREVCEARDYSSLHWLFCDETLRALMQDEESSNVPMLERRAVHFKWFNQGYDNFDDFLARFSSRKRKNVRKERAAMQTHGIVFEVKTAQQITQEDWDRFYLFYQVTYARKSGHGGYLSKDFFERIGQTMPESVVLIFAKKGEDYIAGALYFKDNTSLYGRYWGTIADIPFLHFEACYYQGIEYAIANGLERFDPGVQGEHKIQRGFEPYYTYSAHWLAHPDFSDAVQRFLQEENKHLERYLEDTRACLPFKLEQT